MTRIVSGWLVVLGLSVVATVHPSPSAAQCCGTEQCSGDFNCDGQVTVGEIIQAVNNLLNDCTVPVSADQACADFGTANCSKLDQCILNGTTLRYGGATTCQTRQKQACLVRLGANGTGNTPYAVEGCVSTLPSAPCSDFDLGVIPECEAKTGTLPNSAPCAFSGQCESANCAVVNGTNCGTCSPPNHPGDSCAATSCSTGYVCITASEQCQPRGAAGSTCDADHPCSAGSSCVTPKGLVAGTCQVAGSSVGAACDPNRETAAGCDPNAGLYCDATTKTCLAVTHVTAGAQCGFVNHVTVACTNASTCIGAQGQTPGTCVADAMDGGACDTQAGPACIPPARCVTGEPTATSGVCRLPDPSECV